MSTAWTRLRRLGAELGVDPTAACRHLPGEMALLAGVVEAVLAGADAQADPAAAAAFMSPEQVFEAGLHAVPAGLRPRD